MPHRSDRRLYLDANGQVVEADDPNRASLLVSEGGELPMEDARRYGLLNEAAEKAAPQAEKGLQTAQNAPTARGGEDRGQKPGTPPEAAPEGAARAGQKPRA
jgi:hypothetical protein